MKFKMPQWKFPKFKPVPPIPHPRARSLRASARVARPAFEDYDDDSEPTTRLSSAFIVVLVIHLVFVGGIYAFKAMEARRHTQELLTTPAAVAKPVPTTNDAAFAATATPTPSLHPATAPVPVPAAPSARMYHVKGGDTLAKIAAASSVTVAELAVFNSLKESAPLRAGQTLALPPAKHLATAAAPAAANTDNDVKKVAFIQARDGAGTKTYSVRQGETTVGIARKLGVSQDELLKLNKITDPTKLQIGQVLKVPVKPTPAP